MKTSSFKEYNGAGGICIARGAPRGRRGRRFPGLAPGKWFRSVELEEYLERYDEEVLGVLDPAEILEKLQGLVEPHEPVLLCWETTPLDGGLENWCHRRIVADWLQDSLGIVVPELNQEDSPRTRRVL